MMVVSDLEDVFLPQPDDLLCNLTESREQLESLLQRIPDMFRQTQIVGNALGPALQASYQLIVRSSYYRFHLILLLESYWW